MIWESHSWWWCPEKNLITPQFFRLEKRAETHADEARFETKKLKA